MNGLRAKVGVVRTIYYLAIPLFILLGFAGLACLLSYFYLFVAGDVVSMRKIISKATQIFLLLSIFPLKNYLQLTWSEVGFARRKYFIRQLGAGFLLGLITLLPVMLALYGLDISVIDTGKEWTLIKVFLRLLLAFMLAALISFGEEPLFTGILLAGLKKNLVPCVAVISTALYYSAFHFVKTKTHIPYEDLTIMSGFTLMAEAFGNVLNPEIVSAFIALFVVGLFLAIIRNEFKNSIGVCIGCHTAWVWQIKIGKDFFNTNPDSEYFYLVSSYYDGVVGPLVSVWLSLAIVVYFIWKHFFKDKLV